MLPSEGFSPPLTHGVADSYDLADLRLLFWLLERAGEDPEQFVAEKTLLAFGEASMRRLYHDGLLQRRPGFRGWGELRDRTGRLLSIIERPDGSLWSVDPRDERVPLERLLLRDLPQWRLSALGLAESLHRVNRLKGEARALDERLLTVGEATIGLGRVVIALALVLDQDTILTELLPLCELVPRPYAAVVAVCPGEGPSHLLRQQLAERGVYARPPPLDPPFRVTLSDIPVDRHHTQGEVRLTAAEEAECLRHAFHSRLPLMVTGRRHPKSGNIIDVGGMLVYLSDVPFARFLALVHGAVTAPGGWIAERSLLEADGSDGAERVDQALARIRQPFRSALLECDTTAFIEKRRGRVRLSTHSRFIRVNRVALLDHPMDAVCRVARALRREAETEGPTHRAG